MAAIIFELQITIMLYLDFQRGIAPHNFHFCAAFFNATRMPQFRTLDPSVSVYAIAIEVPFQHSEVMQLLCLYLYKIVIARVKLK